MPDEIEVPEDTEGKVDKPVINAPKVFSQDEVDRFIKERVSREKTAKAKVQEEFDTYKTVTEEEVSFYKGILDKQIEIQLKEAPDSVKNLVKKLSMKEQLEWLADESNAVMLKKTTPTLPPLRGKEDPKEKHKNMKLF